MNATTSFAARLLLLHRALDDAGISHGFGGAVALAYYVAEPRATRDIDLNISVAVEHVRSVLAALPFGIGVDAGAEDAVATTGQVRLWWDGPSGIPVDLFFPQHEFHRHVARDVRPVPFLDATIPIISATHLTVFKSLFNRPRDWPDIAAMRGVGAVDLDAALGWLARLLGPQAGPYLRLSELAAVEAARSTHAGRTGLPEPEGAGPELPVVDWDRLGR